MVGCCQLGPAPAAAGRRGRAPRRPDHRARSRTAGSSSPLIIASDLRCVGADRGCRWRGCRAPARSSRASAHCSRRGGSWRQSSVPPCRRRFGRPPACQRGIARFQSGRWASRGRAEVGCADAVDRRHRCGTARPREARPSRPAWSSGGRRACEVHFRRRRTQATGGMDTVSMILAVNPAHEVVLLVAVPFHFQAASGPLVLNVSDRTRRPTPLLWL